MKKKNFYNIFAIVIKSISYKVFFAIIIAYNLEIEQINIKTVFFYKNIKEPIFVK